MLRWSSTWSPLKTLDSLKSIIKRIVTHLCTGYRLYPRLVLPNLIPSLILRPALASSPAHEVLPHIHLYRREYQYTGAKAGVIPLDAGATPSTLTVGHHPRHPPPSRSLHRGSSTWCRRTLRCRFLKKSTASCPCVLRVFTFCCIP